jgi:hypothetical protein
MAFGALLMAGKGLAVVVLERHKRQDVGIGDYTGNRISLGWAPRSMSENTLIAVALLTVSVPLGLVTTGLVLWKWDRLRNSRWGVRCPLSLAFFLSVASPGVVMAIESWIHSRAGRLSTAPLLKVAGTALRDVVYIYALAVLGSSRVLWSVLLVLAVAGWVGSLVTRNKGAFVAAQCLTLCTFVLPPVLLGLRVIPYVGP